MKKGKKIFTSALIICLIDFIFSIFIKLITEYHSIDSTVGIILICMGFIPGWIIGIQVISLICDKIEKHKFNNFIIAIIFDILFSRRSNYHGTKAIIGIGNVIILFILGVGPVLLGVIVANIILENKILPYF